MKSHMLIYHNNGIILKVIFLNKILSKKLFKGTLLETIILDILGENLEKGLHGYGIICLIRKNFGVYLSPSKIYPELHSLEESGHVEFVWTVNKKRPRKTYKITDKGQQFLVNCKMQLKLIIPSLSEIKMQC